MSPINPNQSTLPSLASYFPQIASSFSSTQTRADDSRESKVQIGNGFMNNLTIGNNNTANNNIYLAASDSKLLETLMLQHIFALQPNTVPLDNLDLAIEKLQKRYLEGLQEDNEVKDALSNYVAPEGMGLYDSTRFDLKNKVQDFLNSDKKVLLLLGEAGSGKSTFNRDLAISLWEAYLQGGKSKNMPIPVFIGLSSLSGPDRNLVSTFFEKQGFSKEQIKELQSTHRFVLILDGFDEIEHRQQIFYKDNELDDWKGSKIIISSRPEYLGPNHQYKFHPSGERTALQEYRLAPFSDETIKRYIDRYSEKHPHALWSAEKYKKELEEPSLKELVSNPFLLKITLSVLPELSQRQQVEKQRITRIAIYDQFVKSWFDRSQQRLNQILEVGSKERKEFKDLEREGFADFGVDFSKELALEMYQAGEVITHYQAVTHARWKKNDTSTVADWHKRLLSNEDTTTVLMRLNAPLICQDRPNNLGKEYRFIHKSLRDYFVARALWEELRRGANSHDVEHSEKLGAIRNVRPVWESLGDKFEFEQSARFNELNVVEDPAVQSFLVERVQEDGVLLKALLVCVKASKTRDDVKRGASNALTVLVKAGVQFNGCDLRGIQVPRADLSYGVFDSAQFEGADLRGANLRASWLREANLSGSQLEGVKLGEWPTLQEESAMMCSAYSPDGERYAVGLNNGKISVYDTSNWAKIHTLSGHAWSVNSVAYSPSGLQLASGSWDYTVRLWDTESVATVQILSGHIGWVNSVAYSPSGLQLASGSSDNTVRLWDTESGAAEHTLSGHTGGVNSVAYSPSGLQLASGSSDGMVCLWDTESGAAVRTLRGHTSRVNSVAYSPSGLRLASGSHDKTVRLWELESGAAVQTLSGHTGWVNSVAYSPSGLQLASGSRDKTVRLWELESGAAVQTLSGHIDDVNSVVYSPSGLQLASGSYDKTVRLWEFESGASVQTLWGHTSYVLSVACSPSGLRLASGSHDKTVRLWESESGAIVRTLSGHTSRVNSVAYSPSGLRLASGSMDNTVRLWDTESGATVQTLSGHIDDVTSVAYSPSGTQLASGSSDETVRLWDTESGAAAHTLWGHTSRVNSVAYSPSGLRLASGSSDSTVRLWDTESGEVVCTLEGHTDYVNSVVYSSSGEQIASGSGDKTVRLWDAQSAEAVRILEGHTFYVLCVVYSPSGEQIASGSGDKTVRLWEVVSGGCLRMFDGFSGAVSSVCWKKENGQEYLLSGSEDKSVRKWEEKKEGSGYKVKLRWSTGHEELNVNGMLLEGVLGLSEVNKTLLKQRGGVESLV
ncbi:MAG: WD40 repeat [Glomeribacter sp. 1016415]|nr:WD40 repeat [Glomeribacter sp. 1016415]